MEWPNLVQGFGRQAPRSLCAGVWLVAGIVFALLAVRLLLTTLMIQGLPSHSGFWLVWIFLLVITLLAFGFPEKVAVGYLLALPFLATADELKWGPCANLPEVTFACVCAGWLTRQVFRRDRPAIPATALDLMVGSFALSLALGTLFALSQPSWENSVSVAFSWAAWPEKTEFNAITMGYAMLAGTMIYFLLRVTFSPADLSRGALRLVMFQVLASGALAVFGVALALGNGQPLSRDFVRLPFGSIHNLAGPAVLLLGFLTGSWVAARKSSESGPLVSLGVAFLLVLVSISKAAWLAILVLGALFAAAFRGWKAFALAGCAGMVVLLVLRFAIPASSLNVKDHLEALTSPSEWAKNHTVSERLQVWQSAGALIMSHPLTGLGLGSFSFNLESFAPEGFFGSKILADYQNPQAGDLDDPLSQTTFNGLHAHNDLLEMAADLGVPSALLWLAFVLVLMATGIVALKKGGNPTAVAVTFCLAGFSVVAGIDARLLSFQDSVLFWQMGAFGVSALAMTNPQGVAKAAWVSLFAPVALAVGMVLAFGNLPASRSYGLWNWRLRDEKGGFLLAKNSQFLIYPNEAGTTLAFHMPADCLRPTLQLMVAVDHQKAVETTLLPGGVFRFPLPDFPTMDRPLVVTVQANAWCGRGALGSGIGVKPYAIAMKKEPAGSSSLQP